MATTFGLAWEVVFKAGKTASFRVGAGPGNAEKAALRVGGRRCSLRFREGLTRRSIF
jgi:hypothetical protein